jgi:hypothetical protein
VKRWSMPTLTLFTAAAERAAAGRVVRAWTAEEDRGELVFVSRSLADEPLLVPVPDEGTRRALGDTPTPVDLLYVNERSFVVAEFSFDVANAFAGTPCEGRPPYADQPFTAWLAAIPRGGGPEQAIPATCNLDPLAFNPDQDQVFLQTGSFSQGAQPGDDELVVVDLDARGGRHAVRVLPHTRASWLVAMEDVAVGVFTDTSPDSAAGPVLGCIPLRGAGQDSSVLPAPTPIAGVPFDATAVVVSPDGRRIYAGSRNVLVELRLDRRADDPCPSVTVVDRLPLEGTPVRLEMDGEGQRLLWRDGDTQTVGLVR